MKKKPTIIAVFIAFILSLSALFMQKTFAEEAFFDYSHGISAKSMDDTSADSLYRACSLGSYGLDKMVFKKALSGYSRLKKEGFILQDQEILSVVDFSRASSEKRLWVVDLRQKKVLFNCLVAHGRNSGELYAGAFSNQPESNQSSLGFYVTGEPYTGKHGLSLTLNGMEHGFNDNARTRGIVVHAADYVSEQFVAARGFLGRSQGCPAVPNEIAESLIQCIKGGSCLFLYYPDKNYERNSAYNNDTQRSDSMAIAGK